MDEVEYEEDEIAPQPAAPSKVGTAYQETDGSNESTEFHGSQMYDYQGRTYMHIPQDLDIDLRGDISDLKNYVRTLCRNTYPESLLTVYSGAQKGYPYVQIAHQGYHTIAILP